MDWRDTVFFDASEKFCDPVFPRTGDLCKVRIRLSADSPVDKIILRRVSGDKGHVLMKKVSREGNLVYYEGEIPPDGGVTRFYFILINKREKTWFYTTRGLHDDFPNDLNAFFIRWDHEVPKWAAERVFYQIFIDRFFDGDPYNNVKSGEYTFMGQSTIARKWGEKPLPFKKSRSLDFFGGDLEGIRKKIPYLSDLGINALYLTPIFKSPSNHKYDTEDFYSVDPHFGGNRALKRLSKDLHNADIKFVLDAVFNHVGASHPWFDIDGNHSIPGAYQSKDSPFYDFFIFNKYPDDYLCWYDAKNLPKLNYYSKALRKKIYEGKNSVIRRWLKPPYNADGWRFDAVDMIGNYGSHSCHIEVLQGMVQAIKETRPDAFLIAEHLFDYGYLLEKRLIHSPINFQGFYLPVRNILAPDLYYLIEGQRIETSGKGYSFETFAKELASMRMRAGGQYAPYTFNFISNHDLPRIKWILKNDRKLGAALAMLFSYPGIPCVYYGDEIGLTGGEDPDNRRCMEWNEKRWDKNLYESYKKWIKARLSLPALKRGSYQELLTKDNTLVFVRESKKQRCVCAVNFSAKPKKISVPIWKAGVMKGAAKTTDGDIKKISRGIFSLTLPAFSGKVYIIES